MDRNLETGGALPHEPVQSELVIEGSPTTGFRALAAVAGAEVGVWEITPGVMRDVEVDEVFVVLSGDGTVTFEDGETVTLAPGAAVRLREGERTVWTIRETVRKIYVS